MNHSINYFDDKGALTLQSIWISDHASKRMQTRGVSQKDIDCLLKYGSQTRQGYLIKKKDAQVAITHLKREISRIDRLASKQTLIVVKHNTVVTTYPTTNLQLRTEFNH
jgi:hypothetical protein